MRQRRRKKLRLGEFREYGFRVRFVTSTLGADDSIDFLDRWVTSAIEDSGQSYGGGGGPTQWDGYVSLDGRGSATEEHRQVIEEWLRAEPLVTEYQIGPLVDAWHGPFDDE